MALQVTDYLARMKQSIGNTDPSTGFVLLDLLNEALRDLYTAHNWEWRMGGPATLDLVASQSYVTLPTDFGQGEIVSVEPIFNQGRVVHLTSMQEVMRLRGAILNTNFEFWVALGWPSQGSTLVAPAQARLEIVPTPSASASAVFRVAYRRGPVQLTSDTQVPNIPAFLESALSNLAMAKAMLAEYGASSPEAQAQMALYLGSMPQLIGVDGGQQSDLGVITNGAVGGCYLEQPLRHFNPADITR